MIIYLVESPHNMCLLFGRQLFIINFLAITGGLSSATGDVENECQQISDDVIIMAACHGEPEDIASLRRPGFNIELKPNDITCGRRRTIICSLVSITNVDGNIKIMNKLKLFTGTCYKVMNIFWTVMRVLSATICKDITATLLIRHDDCKTTSWIVYKTHQELYNEIVLLWSPCSSGLY